MILIEHVLRVRDGVIFRGVLAPRNLEKSQTRFKKIMED